MLNKQDHLLLRLARLKFPEELDQNGEGLTFLFAKGGVGKFTSKTAIHRLSPGDILVFNGDAGSKLAVWNAKGDKGEFLYWTFSVCFENLLPLFSNNEISLLHDITEGFKASKFYPASNTLAAECHRLLEVVPPQFNLDHRGHLIRIAATILSVEFKEGQSQRSGYVRTEDHMVQVFEKLSASELINLSVGELGRPVQLQPPPPQPPVPPAFWRFRGRLENGDADAQGDIAVAGRKRKNHQRGGTVRIQPSGTF